MTEPSPPAGRSLRPRPKQSLKAQEIAKLATNPSLTLSPPEQKALARIVSPRRSPPSRLRLRNAGLQQHMTPISRNSNGSQSPLPSPTFSTDGGRKSPLTSSFSMTQKAGIIKQRSKRSRMSAPMTINNSSSVDVGPAEADMADVDDTEIDVEHVIYPGEQHEATGKRRSAALGGSTESFVRQTTALLPQDDSSMNEQTQPCAATGISFSANSPPNSMLTVPSQRSQNPRPMQPPQPPDADKLTLPTFDYLASHRLKNITDEEDEEDEDDTDIFPDSVGGPGFSALDGRLQVKDCLEKDGFYSWSSKNAIQAYEEQQRMQTTQRPQPNYGPASNNAGLATVNSSLSASFSNESSRHSTPSKPTAVGGRLAASKSGVSPPDARLLAPPATGGGGLGRVTRSRAVPSRNRSPRRRLVDSRTALHDLKVDHFNMVERHKWAIRNVETAAGQLETNANNLDDGLGGRRFIGSEKRKASYLAMITRHAAQLRQIVEESESWAKSNPKELSGFSIGSTSGSKEGNFEH